MDAEIVQTVTGFLKGYLERYPESTVRDIYKLLYQAFHGAEHGVGDTESARRWLIDEWSELSDDQAGYPALIEPIYIEGITPPLFRLNLVPAKTLGIEHGIVHSEFLRTATDFPHSYPDDETNLHELFMDVWPRLETLVAWNTDDSGSEEFGLFTRMVADSGWCASHHSERYRKTYNPHYRLIMNVELFRI